MQLMRKAKEEKSGMANREKNIPADKNTVYNIGSVSKLFAATSIMLLVDDGTVALDFHSYKAF